MKPAIGKLLDNNGSTVLGTAFAVSPSHAFTAFHCIGNSATGEVWRKKVMLEFLTGDQIVGTYEGGSHVEDYAILSLHATLPESLAPIPLLDQVDIHEPFRAAGYPIAVHRPDKPDKPDIYYIGGEVRAKDTTIFGGAPAIQLFSDEGAAGLSLHGMSGGPVLVGQNPEGAIGLVRWNNPRKDAPELGSGGNFWACPVEIIIAQHPQFSDLLLERSDGTDQPSNVVQGDSIKGDKVEGDKITIGDISGSAVAIGEGAQVIQHFHYEEPAEPEKPRLSYEPLMIEIPAGEFWMGSDQHAPEEKPFTLIDLPAFYIAAYPVTNEQYAHFIKDTNRVAGPAMLWNGNEPDADKLCHPVTGVTWYEALEYCWWLKDKTGRRYRLPTEAQWEKAARFTDGCFYPWGNKWETGRCNTTDEITAVDDFPPQSKYGCYDMVGNAPEWTVTSWGRSVKSPDKLFAYPWKPDRRNCPNEPKTTRRIYRGGRRNNELDYRCSARRSWLPDKSGPGNNRIGFRVILLGG